MSKQHHPILSEIDAFLIETGIAETTFGQKAIRQWNLVERLRAGGSVGWRQEKRIRDFMKSKAARQIVPRKSEHRSHAA